MVSVQVCVEFWNYPLRFPLDFLVPIGATFIYALDRIVFKMKPENYLFLTVLLVSVILVSGCASQTPTSTANSRNDFGCWPPSCSYISDPQGKQICEDWKAGKSVQWPDCSSFTQYPNCQKLCESEKQNISTPTNTPANDQCSVFASVPQCSYVGSPDSDYYKMCAQCFPDKAASSSAQTGIPANDPGAENVWIYFTEFKHGRIIRMDDMTGKNWISYGTNGTGVGQFISPERFTVQPDGHIYIADADGNRIVRIDDMTGKGWISYGTQGFFGSVGQFNQPHAVRLDSNGRIYIADGNCRIARIDDMTGKGWTVYGGDQHCGPNSTSLAGNPFDIAFDAQDRIYIMSDNDNQRIIRIDDMTGKNRVSYGASGTGVGQFLEPQSITIDAQGRLYIADEDKATQGGRIIRIDDMTGAGWVIFPLTNPDPRIRLPHDIAVSASGKIYIADTKNNGIARIDDMTGKGYIEYAPYPDGPRNIYPNQLEAPKGIFITPR